MERDINQIYIYLTYPEFEFSREDAGYQCSVNIAPAELDINATFDDVIVTLNAEIKSLQRLKSMLNYANKQATVDIQYDFYWKDNDLLVRVAISLSETRLKLKL